MNQPSAQVLSAQHALESLLRSGWDLGRNLNMRRMGV